MEVKVIDNFLLEEDLRGLQDSIVNNDNFPLYIQHSVAYDQESNKADWKEKYWNWYATHKVYDNDQIVSPEVFPIIQHLFVSRIKEVHPLRSLMRIKINFYPYTDTVREHAPHVDYDFDHYGAIFALNTCDGFTRLTDGTKIESVENRFFIFNASQFHNSSTTSDAQSRYNINFNFL